MAWLWLIICPPFRSSAGFQLSSAGLFWWWKLWSRPRSGSVPMPCPKGTALRDSTANGAGFEIFVGGTMQTKIIGITGTFAMLVILGIVVIMTANKFFSLIHYLPEHVTNWIGQQFHALGEKEDQASVKNVFVGSTNAVSSGAHGARELRGDISRQWNNPGAGNARTSTPQAPASSPRPGLTQQNFRS